MKYNQQQKGKSQAFAQFQNILGQQIMSGIPDMKDDVQGVLETTGEGFSNT